MIPTVEDRSLDAIEGWFVARGLPHLVDRHEPASEIWGRAIPLLVFFYLTQSLNVLKVTGNAWSLGENVSAALFGLGVALATWMIANRLRGRPLSARPTHVGPAELAVFLIGPAIPSVLFGQWSDGLETIAGGLVLLAFLWAITSYGVPSLLRWAGRRARAQLALLGSVVTRALPLLLLFTAFLFINAEVWQVAGTLTGPVYLVVIGVFVVLGALFLLSRLPGLMRSLNRFARWREVELLVRDTPADPVLDALGLDAADPVATDRPGTRARFNIGLVTLFSQGIQITVVAVALTAFFVAFGFLAIPESTIIGWTTMSDVHVWWRWDVGGRSLVLSEPLIRVAAFLGAFSGMYFTVQLATDASYREEFTEDMGPLLRQALAVRCVYRRALVAAEGADGGRTP